MDAQPSRQPSKRTAQRRHQAGPVTPYALPGAKESEIPAWIEPQLATLAAAPPAAGDWIVENKFDGYRMLARVGQHGDVEIFSRNKNRWTAKLASLVGALREMSLPPCWLDGEIVELGADALPDFNALQNAIAKGVPNVVYFVFDVMYAGGYDLRHVALSSRRNILHELLNEAGETIRISEALEAAPPARLLNAACRLGLEGLMLKRADAPYTSGRTSTWLKLKCQRVPQHNKDDERPQQTESQRLFLG